MPKVGRAAAAAMVVILVVGACSSSEDGADGTSVTTIEAGDGGSGSGDGATEPITTVAVTLAPPDGLIYGTRILKPADEPPTLPAAIPFQAGEASETVTTVGSWGGDLWVDAPLETGYTFNPIPQGILVVPNVDTGALYGGRFQRTVSEGAALDGPGMLIVFDADGSPPPLDAIEAPEGCHGSTVATNTVAGLDGEVRTLDCGDGSLQLGYAMSSDPAGVVRFSVAGTADAPPEILLAVLDTLRFGPDDDAIAARLSSSEFGVAGNGREDVDLRYGIDLHDGALGDRWRHAIVSSNTGLVEIRNYEGHGYRLFVGQRAPIRIKAREAITLDMRVYGSGIVPIVVAPDFGFARLVTYLDLNDFGG